MNKAVQLILVLCMLMLSACSTLKTTSDFDPNASFANLKTYNWLPQKFKPSGDPKLDSNQLLHKRINLAMENWFNQHGYSKQSASEADLLIGYFVVVEQKTEITVLHDSYGYPYGWRRYGYYPTRSQTYAREFDQGTLIIDIVSNKTQKLLWRGTAIDEIEPLPTPEEKSARVQSVVDAILQAFPPQ